MGTRIEIALHSMIGRTSLDVAFNAEAGLVALFGRSGAGKSLTLAHIAGLMRPRSGRIAVGDQPMFDSAAKIDIPAHRRRIGLVFQDAQLFPHLNVRRNLLFGRWFDGSRASRIGFDRVVETLGLGALLQRAPARLSGGERQRVAIGRALLAEPHLLMFDEPLAALDRQRKLEILPLVERLRDEFAVPILYVSHSIAEVVRLASQVVVLEEGRVVRTGRPAEVLGSDSDQGRFGRISILSVAIGARDDAYDLTALDHPAGRLWALGRPGQIGQRSVAVIRATDITLATGSSDGLSVRSRLVGEVGAIEVEGPLASVEVRLRGGDSVTAFVTRLALDELGLAPGSTVTALVKAVALDEATLPPG